MTSRSRNPSLLQILPVLFLGACGESPAGLSPPPPGDWPVGTLASVGLAEQPFLDLRRDITFGSYGDVQSVLVVRHGQLVFEEYFGEGDPEERHRLYSVTKSVAATLVGIAHDRGLIEDLDRPLLDFFPQYESVENPQGKDAITLRHALQMRTGIEWDEWSTNYSDPTNVTTLMSNSDDWHRFVLDRPMAAGAGQAFVYNSGVSNLLAGVIRNVTGQATWDFADDALFGPLGIDDRRWWITPDSMAVTGWGLHLRSRDMARFGLLYLQRGLWEGERILSEGWVDASMERATHFSDGGAYGFQWWIGAPDDQGRRAWSARGWGGQFVVVVPWLDAVIVTTQSNYDGLHGLDPSRLVEILERAAAG